MPTPMAKDWSTRAPHREPVVNRAENGPPARAPDAPSPPKAA